MKQIDPYEALAELARQADEPLDPELEDYLEESDSWGLMLRHPLVYQIPLFNRGQANEALRKKQRMLARALDAGDWDTAIWLHERPHRTEAMIDFVVGRDGITDEVLPVSRLNQELRNIVADVWVDSENQNQHLDDWAQMFTDPEPLMLATPEERAQFAQLPEELTVFRAGIDDGGWSWTLDPLIAVFFAQPGRNHSVGAPMVTGRVDKSVVFGYLTRRAEAEVLVPDGSVRDVKPYVHKEKP